jgi:uncharacterized protein (DUF488 family)
MGPVATEEETRGDSGLEVYTVGHSTRSIEELIALLRAHGVTRVLDVRSVPRSRHNPQFEAGTLAAALAAEGIDYAHLPALGGFRKARKGSPNSGLRHPAFRGYADHMQTEEFEEGVGRLLSLAGERRSAVMCAEANPMRCHRRLLADALTARGVVVRHIGSARSAVRHVLSAEAEVRNGRVHYPAPHDPLF